MAGFKNEFSWSKSREELFRKCQKQYYYHYYGSWGGWHRDCDARTRTIYILKKLVNRHLWSGEKVRQAINRLLANLKAGKEEISEKELLDYALNKMREDFRNSRERQNWISPQNCGLFEHEYDIEMSNDDWKEVAQHVENCIRNFYQSEVYQEIKKAPLDQWLEIEDLTHFILNEMKVYIAVDFTVKEKDEIVIYDWKTGTSLNQNHDLQMACYGWYAWQHWNVDPKKIQLVEINLLNNKVVKHKVQGVNLEKIQKKIFSSIQDMQFLLDDIGNNQANEERFAFTDNERFCDYCNFKKTCPKWQDEEPSFTSS